MGICKTYCTMTYTEEEIQNLVQLATSRDSANNELFKAYPKDVQLEAFEAWFKDLQNQPFIIDNVDCNEGIGVLWMDCIYNFTGIELSLVFAYNYDAITFYLYIFYTNPVKDNEYRRWTNNTDDLDLEKILAITYNEIKEYLTNEI